MAETAPNPDGCVLGCNDDKCKKIREEIDERINRNKHDPAQAPDGKGIHGLSHQFRELRSAIERGDFSRAQSHLDQIRGNQGKLKKALEDLKKNGCGDPPAGGWSWAERSTKDFEDAIADHNASLLRTGAEVATAGVVAYGAYRFIRFLPSLAPPLWWTIPANAVAP